MVLIFLRKEEIKVLEKNNNIFISTPSKIITLKFYLPTTHKNNFIIILKSLGGAVASSYKKEDGRFTLFGPDVEINKAI